MTCRSNPLFQVLHRLDHSIHTMRLYVATIAKKLCSDWNMSAFFKVVHTDMNLCLEQLNDLRLPGKTTFSYIVLWEKYFCGVEHKMSRKRTMMMLLGCGNKKESNCRFRIKKISHIYKSIIRSGLFMSCVTFFVNWTFNVIQLNFLCDCLLL